MRGGAARACQSGCTASHSAGCEPLHPAASLQPRPHQTRIQSRCPQLQVCLRTQCFRLRRCRWRRPGRRPARASRAGLRAGGWLAGQAGVEVQQAGQQFGFAANPAGHAPTAATLRSILTTLHPAQHPHAPSARSLSGAPSPLTSAPGASEAMAAGGRARAHSSRQVGESHLGGQAAVPGGRQAAAAACPPSHSTICCITGAPACTGRPASYPPTATHRGRLCPRGRPPCGPPPA